MFTFSHAVMSDVGLQRKNNQDSAFASDQLLAVADGMGGHAGGNVASAIAIDCLTLLDPSLNTTPMAALERAVGIAGQRLQDTARHSPTLAGMGTTLTAILLDRRRIALLHIGDSRAYLLRSNRLHQLTIDHTLVHDMVENGLLTAEQAAQHANRSLLTRALDATGEAKPDLSMHEVHPSDRFLLCSDGLTGTVAPERLLEVLTRNTVPAVAVQELINEAYLGGAPDNVTCIVADVHAGPAPAEDAPRGETRAGAITALARAGTAFSQPDR
jgi:serine/threonine protein phosphatase PrpC